MTQLPDFRQVEPAALTEILMGRVTDGFAVRRNPKDRGVLFSHRRQLDDGDLLFLVNTSITHATSGTIKFVRSSDAGSPSVTSASCR